MAMKHKTERFIFGQAYVLPEISSEALSSALGWKYGYHFDKWVCEGEQLSSYSAGDSVVFSHMSIDLSAAWRPYEFEMQPISAEHCTVTVVDSLGRTIGEGDTVVFDTRLSVTAVPDEGYAVDKIHLQVNSSVNSNNIFNQSPNYTYYDQLSSNGQPNVYESTMISHGSRNHLNVGQFSAINAAAVHALSPFGGTQYVNTKAWLSVEVRANGFATFWDGYSA